MKPTGYAGLVVTRHNRVYKPGWVSIYKADQAGLDPTGGNWVTVCEAHGTLCNHRTRKIAEWHLTTADWCEECQTLLAEYIDKELRG